MMKKILIPPFFWYLGFVAFFFIACSSDENPKFTEQSDNEMVTACPKGFYQAKPTDLICRPVSGAYVSLAGSVVQFKCKGDTIPKPDKGSCTTCGIGTHTEDNIRCISSTRSCVKGDLHGQQIWSRGKGWGDCSDPSSICTPRNAPAHSGVRVKGVCERRGDCNSGFYKDGRYCSYPGKGKYADASGNLRSCTSIAHATLGPGTPGTTTAASCSFTCARGYTKKGRQCIGQIQRCTPANAPAHSGVRVKGVCERRGNCKPGFYKDGRYCSRPGDGKYADANSILSSCTSIAHATLGRGTTTAASCSFTCARGYTKKGRQCIGQIQRCTPRNAPAHSGVRVSGVCERRGDCNSGFYKNGRSCSYPGDGKYADTNGNLRSCTSIAHATLGRGTTTAASCSFTCNSGYTKQGRQCIRQIQRCTPANAPTNSGVMKGFCERRGNCNPGFYKDGRYCSRPGSGKYADTNGNLSSCTSIAHATLGRGTTTAASCSFTCNSGYTKQGRQCIRQIQRCTPRNAPTNSGVRVNGFCERRGDCNSGFYKNGRSCSYPGDGKYADTNGNLSSCTSIAHATLGRGTTTAASCSFTCNSGYTKQGRQCIRQIQRCTPANAPTNSGVRVNGFCERRGDCNSGFYKNGRSCSRPGSGKYADANSILKSCASIAHATLGRGTTTAASCSFTCNSGYTKQGRQCIRQIQRCTPRNAPTNSGVRVNGFCERRGNCNPGFYKDGRYCSRPGSGKYADTNGNLSSCTSIAHATLGRGTTTAASCSFTCNSGYTKQGRQCIRQIQRCTPRNAPTNSGVRVNGFCERRGDCNSGFYKNGRSCSYPGDGKYADTNGNLSSCTSIAHATLGRGTTTAASCSFTCNSGYTKQGRQCIRQIQRCTPANAPTNSGVRVNGFCERRGDCNSGFYKNGRSCSRPGSGKYADANSILKSCASIAHATLGRGTTTAASCSFTCNSGYTKQGRQCIRQIQRCTPANAPAHSGVRVNGVCERRGNCNSGFYKNGRSCSRPGNGKYADANSILKSCASIAHATLGPGTPGTTTAASCSFTCHSGYTKQGRQCVENAPTQQAQNQICPVTRDQVRHQPFSSFDKQHWFKWAKDRIVVDYNFSLCLPQNRTKVKQALEYAMQTWNAVSTSRIHFQLGSEFTLSDRIRTSADSANREGYPESQKLFVLCENDPDKYKYGDPQDNVVGYVSSFMESFPWRQAYATVHLNAINGHQASLNKLAKRYSENIYKSVLLHELGHTVHLNHVDNKHRSIMNTRRDHRKQINYYFSTLDKNSITYLYPTAACQSTRSKRSLASFMGSASTFVGIHLDFAPLSFQDQAMENQKEDEINEMELHSQPLPSSDHDPHAHDPHAEDSSHSFCGGVEVIELED